MNATGKSLIAGEWVGAQGQNTFYGFHPASNTHSDIRVYCVTPEQVEAAAVEAAYAFPQYRRLEAAQRADFLEEIGKQIMALGNQLIETTQLETGLPQARLENERGRTVNQLNLFAQQIRSRNVSVKEAEQPDRQPLPKPKTQLSELPVGPVAVFGASNFPYAFSTAGGDTASALAAGCPVIVKGHPAHPLTGELTARAIQKAMEICNIPNGVFSLLQGYEPAISHQLVAHRAIKAVGFTGSHAVGMSLQKTINSREEMIPLYGELGSVNPQVILPGADEERQIQLAQTLSQSLLMSNGQLCTSPGVWFVPQENTPFVSEAKAQIQKSGSDTLLTPRINESYQTATDALALNDQLANLAMGKLDNAHHAQAKLFKTDMPSFVENEQLQQEVFGPSALIVTYENPAELLQGIDILKGQLAASIYGQETDIVNHQELVEALGYRVGRLIFNQAPTGVEVCETMHHGGPYPSSTDVRYTSVGSHAIDRFLRPICYQNAPDNLMLK